MTLPRYPAYKDSGVEWLGEVPVHWNVFKLKRCVSLLTEKTNRRSNPVGLENIEGWSGRFVPSESDFQGEGVAFEPGDVLFGKLRPYLAKAMVADKPGEAVGDFHVMRPRRGTGGEFLAYQIRTQQFVSIVDGSTYGAKMPRVNWEFMGGMPLSLPPEEEQTLITAFLDHEASKIDTLIAEQQNLIALLKEKRQAVISHAVTKGLNPDVPVKNSGVEWLGQVPGHWHVSPLKWLTGPGRDIMYGIVLPGPNVEQGVPIVKGGDVRPVRLRKELLNRTTAEIEAPFARARLNPGDIVYSIRGSIGDAELVPEELRDANITQDVARISPHSEVCGRWLLFVMKSAPVFVQLEQRSLGAAVRGINIFDLKRALIPVPSGVEQEAIADFLERKTVMIDSLIAESEHAVALLTERRSALISAAVTGKIDVRGLVPQEAA